MLKKTILIGLMLCGMVNAATYYVDSAATGAGNGTSWADAWTSLGSITGLSAGDTVDVNDGSYGTVSLSDIVGSDGSPITIRAASGADLNLEKLTLTDCNYVVWDGIDIYDETPASYSDYGIKLDSCQDVNLTNLIVRKDINGTSDDEVGIMISTSTDCIISDCNINTLEDGIRVYGGSTGTNILRTKIHSFDRGGIRISTNNVVIDRCELWDNALESSPFAIELDDHIYDANGYTGIIIRDTGVFDAGTVYLYDINDVEFKNCTIAKKLTSGTYNADIYGTALYLTFATNATGEDFKLYNNIFVGKIQANVNTSPWTDIDSSNNIVFSSKILYTYGSSMPDVNSIHIMSGNTNIKDGFALDMFLSSADTPFFDGGVDTANRATDLILASDSNAISFANPTYSSSIDLVGNERDVNPDAGALEYIEDSNTPETAPDAPSNIVAIFDNNDTITITWTDNSDDEDGFYLQYSLDGIDYDELYTNSPNDVNYIHSELDPNICYYYRVCAYNGSVLSDYATSGCISTEITDTDTYYVDPVNGLDTNVGTSLKPFQSIGKALSSSSWGDTILLNDGEYPYFYYSGTEYEGDANDLLPTSFEWITIRSINQHAAIFKYEENQGQRCMDLGVSYGHNGTLKLLGLVFDGISFNGSVNISCSLGLRIKNCKSYSTYAPSEFSNLTAYHVGFGIGGSTLSGDIRIEDTEIYNSFKGIGACAYNLVIRNCDIYNIGCHHIWLSGKENVLVENNILRDHIKYSDDHGDAIIVYTTSPFDNLTIRNNKVYNHVNQGLFISWGSSTLVNNLCLENNLFYNIGGYAITVANTHSASIRNNTVSGGTRFGTSGVTNLTDLIIQNNIFATCYDYMYDSLSYTAVNNNIYVIGAGGGGYANLCSRYADNFSFVKDTILKDTDLFSKIDPDYFSLSADSRAIAFGSTQNATTTDILGNSRDATPDAGCYEYIDIPFIEPETEPNQPTDISATTISPTQINLTWSDNADDEIGYKLQRSATSAFAGFAAIATLGYDIESYSDTGLTAATQYWYRVCAYNSVGNSDYSSVVTATTSAAPADPTPIPDLGSGGSKMLYLGDYTTGATLYMTWDSTIADGNIAVYRGNNAIGLQGVRSSADVNGITDIRGFAGLTGVNNLKIATAGNSTFYQAGYDYSIVLKGATYDSNEVNFALGSFSIQNRYTPSTDILQTSTKVDNLYNQFNSVYFEKIDKVDEIQKNTGYSR